MHNDFQDRKVWRQERSLLALGSAIPSEAETAVPDYEPGVEVDPTIRHRAARERREAVLTAPPAVATQKRPWFAAPDGDIAEEADLDAGRLSMDAPAVPRHGRPWRLLAVATLLGALVGAAIGLSLPLRYQATAELSLRGNETAPLSQAAFDSRLRLLTSGMVLTRVADRLNLNEDTEFNGSRTAGTSLGELLRAVLLSDRADADAGHRQAVAVDRLAASLTVSRTGPGSAVAVTATTTNGEKSALIANAVADVFVEVYRQLPGSGADSDAVTSSDHALASTTRALADFARDHGLDDPAQNPARIADILRLDQDLKAARAQVETLKARLAVLSPAGSDPLAGSLPSEFETAAVRALRSQYLDIKRQADRVAHELGPRNPERQAVEAQLHGARDRLSAELRRIAASRQDELKKAVEKERALAASLADTGLDGEAVARLRQLQHAHAEAQIDRRAVTASIPAQADTSPASAHVISRAAAATEPSGPPRMTLTLAGALLGLFAGLGIATMRGSEKPAPKKPARAAHVEGSRAAPEAAEPDHGQDQSDDPWISSWQAAAAEHATLPHFVETDMYRAYRDHPFAQPQQPYDAWQHNPAPAVPHAYPPPIEPAIAAPAYPVRQAYPHPAYPQAWQPMPPAQAHYQPYAYAQPPSASPYYPSQPFHAHEAGQRPMDAYSALDEIRASLREFREALNDLAERRSRRRIS